MKARKHSHGISVVVDRAQGLVALARGEVLQGTLNDFGNTNPGEMIEIEFLGYVSGKSACLTKKDDRIKICIDAGGQYLLEQGRAVRSSYNRKSLSVHSTGLTF